MVGTLLSIAFAVFLFLRPLAEPININYLAALIFAFSVPLFLLFPLGLMVSWTPIQKAELNSTPRVMEMFRRDWHIRLVAIWAIFFLLITFVLMMDLLYMHFFTETWDLIIWIVLFGISIDISWHFIKRVLGYLNPLIVVNMFTREAKKSIQNNREVDLCQWIDALSEIAVKGLQRNSTSVCNLALDEEEEIGKMFLEASKSIAHREQDPESIALGIVDKVSYTMHYMYQRLDMIFDKALHGRFENSCTHIVTLLGKIAVSAAKYDVSLASAPLRFIGKCGKRALDAGLEETALTASCTLFEVGKAILTEIDISYYEIKDPFLSIINGTEILSKGAFKQDKSMNLILLIQPFKDLKTLFESGKAKEHQDTPIIVANIDRVIGEFEALRMVMATMPPIPVVDEG